MRHRLNHLDLDTEELNRNSSEFRPAYSLTSVGAPLSNNLLHTPTVASFYYRWREIGWIEKRKRQKEEEIEIGRARPEANKTEEGINFIIQLSFWPDPCALNITSFINRFESASTTS